MEKQQTKRNEQTSGIQARISDAFIRVMILLCIGSVVGIIAIFVMSSQYESAMENYGFSQGDIGMVMSSFAETRSALRGAIGYEEQEEIDELLEAYEEEKALFNQYFEELAEHMVTDAGREAYKSIEDSLEGYWELSDEILKEGAVTDREVSAKAQSRACEELGPRYEAVYAALDDLMNVNVKKGDETRSIMLVAKIVVLISMVEIVLVALMRATRIAKKIAYGIQKPLEELGARLNAFAHGYLDSPFPQIDTQDEIALMIDECNAMADNLNAIMSDTGYLLGMMAEGNFAIGTAIEEKYEGKFQDLLLSMRKLNRQLDGTLRQINQSSEQVSAGANQLAESAQDLAEGATDQAGAVEELVATVESVTNISQESAENASKAAVMTKESAENANESREKMNELTEAMRRITDTSKEIENIIATIEDIASQTNLLSLNASIEAARAGEAGKGFAVVADQIGKLASDSASSAVMTRELIGKALEEIRQGNEIAELSVKEIEEIIDSMETFAQMASGSAEASRTQADMLKQVEAGIEQISSVVQSNSAASEETSAVSEELSAQATSLEELVEKFELREE